MEKSKYQEAIIKVFNSTNKDINISAVAGSGKTTILLELLKYIPENSKTLFLAFNNSIVDELKKRNQKEGIDIMTIHSCGWRLILGRYGFKNAKLNKNKAIAKTEKVLKEFNIPEKKKGFYFYAIPKILDLMRCNLTVNDKKGVIDIINRYDINLEDKDIPMVIRAYDLMLKDFKSFDFTDMIFHPIQEDIRFSKYDYVFCDESQDFSIAQQEFIKRCISRKGRLVTVGDPRQAIYGFAGADADSYSKLATINGKSIKMPLSVSYRCGKNIIIEAQKVVPEIQYNFLADRGSVKQGSLLELQQGDWILCRNLKPLVQTYLWLMKNKIKSKIRGKDIGEGILSLINKTHAKTLETLDRLLGLEVEKLINKLEKNGVRRPNLHPKMELLLQKIEVINCLCEEVNNVSELKKIIEDIFSDDIKGILLTTIHKAKGLENNKIFFLAPELIPSRFATQDWQLEQERNLKYVAITRAKKELVYVSSDVFLNDIKNKITVK